jgi:hypothetical protein
LLRVKADAVILDGDVRHAAALLERHDAPTGSGMTGGIVERF